MHCPWGRRGSSKDTGVGVGAAWQSFWSKSHPGLWTRCRLHWASAWDGLLFTLTPRDAQIIGELNPGSHPGSWRDGEQRDLGVQATQEALVKEGCQGVPGYMPLQPHQALPTFLGGFSDKSVSESRVERALVFCWLRSQCLQSKEKPHREKAQPVTSLICLTNTCWEPPHPRVPARQRPSAKTEWRPVFRNGGGTCPVPGGRGRVHRLWC